MKRVGIGAIIVIIIAFVLITIYKNETQKPAITDSEINSEKRSELDAFWHLYRQATSFRIEGEWENAIKNYQKALEINPNHEDAIYYLGNMYLETGFEKEAEIAWQRLLTLRPNSSRAHFQLGNLYMYAKSDSLFDLRKAELEFETALRINKDFMQTLIQLGQLALYQGNVSQSLEHLTTVLGSDPKNITANFLCGFIIWKTGDRTKALEYFTAAYKNSGQEKLKEGISGEGDTKEGRSFERRIHRSMFESYFIDLSSLSEKNLEAEMESRYQQLTLTLVR